jgi:hypothetical protein
MTQNLEGMSDYLKFATNKKNLDKMILYFCNSMNSPKLEIFLSLRQLSVKWLVSLGLLLGMGFGYAVEAQTYEAKDEYKNIVFTLTLKADQTYHFEEKYLDGSVWIDSGKWVQEGEELILHSFEKTTRKHYYLQFKKAYKFKGDVFRVEEKLLHYTKKGNQKLNGHYHELKISQLPPSSSSPGEMATE